MVAVLNAIGEKGIRLAPLKNQTLEKVRAAATRDPEYQALREAIINGFPEHCHDLESYLRPYWGIRSLLALDDDLIVYGPRLLIPRSLRCEILSRLHDCHQGMGRTKRRARQTTYWSGIDKDIENVVSGCHICRPLLPKQQSEPLWQDDDPRAEFSSLSLLTTFTWLAVHTWCTSIVSRDGHICHHAHGQLERLILPQFCAPYLQTRASRLS